MTEPNGSAGTFNRKRRDWHDYVRTLGIPVTFLAAAAAAAFTGLAANYTHNQWRTAEDTEKRQLRAYVGFIPGDLDNFGNNERQEFRFVAKNFGITSGYNFDRQYEGSVIIQNGQGISPPTANCPTETKSTETIFPSQELTYHERHANFSQQQFDLVRTSETSPRGSARYGLVYFGKFCYNDAFGSVHYTKYCFSFFGQSMTHHDVGYCNYHNESD